MKIGELARMYGVSRRQIRHYEELGLLTSIREDSSNYRIYDRSTCDRLEAIKLLRDLSFSLGEIGRLLDSPYDDGTRRLFEQKSAELERSMSALSNRVQILRSVARVLDEHGASELRLASVVKECTFIHSKNERVLPMLNDKTVIEIGIGLVPTCEGADSPLLTGIKQLRQSLESELDIVIPAVRVRDNIELGELSLVISIDGKPVCQRTYASCSRDDTAEDIMSLLASCIRDNASAYKG